MLSTIIMQKLNSGYEFPVVGLGTWQAKPGEVEEAVVVAIESGYRHIDCAYVYGNEAEVGTALQKVMRKRIVKRSDLFIVTKLWNTKHHAADVKPALQDSLTKLGLDYLDLYLIHWPMSFKAGPENFPRDEEGNILYDNVHYLETWKALESCVDEGLIRSIGISNFNSQQIQDILDHGRIKPAVLQVEVNPYFQQHKLVTFCQERGIVVTGYSNFGSPTRPIGLRPGADMSEMSQLDDPTLIAIARRSGKSPAQVILRWLIQRNVVVIPKSVNRSRIQDNIKVFDFELSESDMELIHSIDKNMRSFAPVVEKDRKIEFRDKTAPFFPYQIEF